MKTALFVVGQKRSIIDTRMQMKLKEALKYFDGDIFFVLEEDNNSLDLSIFNPKEVIYYKFNGTAKSYVLMSFGWSHCMNLMHKYEKINETKYDVVYKTRPDLLLRNYIPTELNINKTDLEKKIVWGETIGDYGTNISHPAYAIKDTFNVITRSACEDFFTGFHNFVLYTNIRMCSEAMLGYFLFNQNVEKRVINCSRTIIRMAGQETTYGAKSLGDDIENIKINDEMTLVNDHFPTHDIISSYKLFWQYPVITEKTFYEQNKDDKYYLGFPWATIIDKRYKPNIIYNILKKYIIPGTGYYTCCQHISFRNLIPLFKSLGICRIYTPHKTISENSLNEIEVKPCPLYAVNIEDPERNTNFIGVDLLNINRKILYSFQGAYDRRWYLTNIRKNIFDMKHPDNCYIHNIGQWHFDNVVYNKSQNKDYELNENDSDKERTNKYNNLLLASRFSICPSGSGPNSIRFWESLGVGAIPVLLADTLDLPSNDLWNKTIIRILESDYEKIPLIISNISGDREREMRKNCLEIYQYYKNNYKNIIR